MGKVQLPPLPREFGPRMLPWIILAITLGLAVVVLGGLLVLRLTRGPQTPLPTTSTAQLPLGNALPRLDPPPLQSGQPLTNTNPGLPAPGQPLPNVNQQLPAPTTALPQAPSTPQPGGEVRWQWAIYPVDPQVLGVLMGDKVAGNQFVALGVDVWNGSSIPIVVQSGDFRLVVDNRAYSTDVWATGSASLVQGLPVMSPEPVELMPGGTLSGTTSFMIPAQYQSLSPDWRLIVPPGIKVVRIDP